MGIETDQLVFDYLSRVGDLAQQQQLPAGERMRLVAGLRGEIDRSRARPTTPDSPAAVRRILSRLGSPEDVVAGAGTTGAGAAPRSGAPAYSPDPPAPRPSRFRGFSKDSASQGAGTPADGGPDPAAPGVPRPRTAWTGGLEDYDDGGSAKSRAGNGAEWWRTEAGGPEPHGFFGGGDQVAGFVGGIEAPEMLGLRPRVPTQRPGDMEEKAPPEVVVVEEPAGKARRRLRVPRPGTFSNPLLLLAAAALVVGAVLGSWLPLAAGWLLAWASRRLSTNESKVAVIGIPALSLAAGAVWLWGRGEGRWGAPLARGEWNAAIADTWPSVVRIAAISSALFLVWRSQRTAKAKG
ncbi:HAAS signaling domain-containing protein [Streptomyces sp. NPDC088768]|uniref:HAAS signaling domain-containing protein n=1 Tax=Streptomyces sp. NPDC088768 TaxID=3365894 RepID=UPI003812C54A